MAKLIFHLEHIPDKAAFAALCPFGAIEVHGDAVEPTAGCKMCGLCVKKGPAGAAEMMQDAPAPQVDKSAWRGILVYADHVEGTLHPVTFELLGKARELAAEIGHPVYALLLGDGVKAAAEELTHWGADRVLVYDQPALRDFRLDAYTAAFADAVAHLRPTAILVGATTVGRQLAPRVAARLHTGLTADCTVLKMEKNTDLVQYHGANHHPQPPAADGHRALQGHGRSRATDPGQRNHRKPRPSPGKAAKRGHGALRHPQTCGGGH